MIDLNDYFYFVHVVEKRGFSSAAKALNMPKSRLSRHVTQLEERLDTRLIQRTSRQFNVTEAGQVFYEHARTVIEDMEVAEAAFQSRQATLNGCVNLSCSVGVAQFAIQELVFEFLVKYPNVELVQQVTNQTVDLVASGLDMAIRGHMDTMPDSSIIQRRLAMVSWHLFASPEYLDKTGTPKSPEDLRNKQSLKVGWQPTHGLWNLENSTGVKSSIPFSPKLCSDDMATLKQAAAKSLGIVNLPAYTCRAEVDSGTLVRVLPDWTAGLAQLSLVTPSRLAQSPAVRALIDHLLNNVHSRVGDKSS
ncbi:LysR substrate-binding domain-containing protein [Glaciecola sp. KUL10]|uniref:LysR substrate-binding domain-containing protein n=1 Tax=Glaciecola sp. (strain KUL10) TaxID=2161813 RepID=UPI000D8E9E33|nr:LysR substrate-binding domain-containing protein [Glaciecola sp. KUL10]GBL05270.1 LysR family transcriptional regulatory protein [Glaciecola sp. KUL10]